jgi:hypothetical protein
LKVGRENASPPPRQINDNWSFAERDQTFERAPSHAGDRGGFT